MYKYVDPQEDRKGLLPSRIEGDFCIELKGGSTPVNMGPYRMSYCELKEVKIQITKPLE